MPQFENVRLNKTLPYLETGKVYTIKRGLDEEEEVLILSKRRRKNEVLYLMSSVTYGSFETTTYGTHEYEALLRQMGITTTPASTDVPVAEYDESAA